MGDDRSGSRLRWLGAAGFELELGPVSVLVDPFISYSHHTHPGLGLGIGDLRAGVIFVTHGHLDHAADVPAIAQRTGAPVYAATSVCETLHDLGVPVRQLHPLAAGRLCRVGHVSVLAVAARHVRFDLPLVWRTARRVGLGAVSLLRTFGAYACGDVLGYRFATNEGTVVHFGSAGWYRDELVQLHPDVALLPLQGHSRIHSRVVQAAEWLRPGRVIPHHHDDFFPPLSQAVPVQPLVALMRQRLPEVEVVEPRVGRWMPLF
jgi:L-ascorbate metabolism protein UlaG (beta-lactamase superfamily)